MRNVFMTSFVVLLLLCSARTSAQNLELGFKPGHVFGIWQNINQVLTDISSHDSNADTAQQSAAKFYGKQPQDVLTLARQFEARLNMMAPSNSEFIVLLSDELNFQFRSNEAQIKPTQVYLFSSKLLFQVVGLSLQLNEGKHAVGPYFNFKVYRDKTPSDVYGLVSKALKQLERLAKQPERGLPR